MIKEINTKLMALDEMGYIIERIMDEFVQIFDKNGKLILTSDFKSVRPYEELLTQVSEKR